MKRRAAVAGSWYPDDAKRLAWDIDRYLAGAVVDAPPRRLRALIAPHAGLIYSGPVAAFAYRQLQGATYKAVVLVGPSHFVPFSGISVSLADEWETPMGAVAVATSLAEAIRAECPVVIDLPEAHRREHSLEMQLPFVTRVLPGVPIVPLVMGHQTRETARALGDALAHVLANVSNDLHDPNDSTVLLIASSDLSHYENAVVAARMDAVMIRHIQALDDAGLMDVLEHEPRHACGGGPMVSVLHAARQHGAKEARVLRYADSGDVSGDKSSVVGYLAAGIW